MKIFLSHSGRDKPLVREIIKYLPNSIQTWLDEDNLPLGTEISKELKNAITNNSDLIVLFISQEAINSSWVKKELEWAIEREKTLGYTFIFPIVLDENSWKNIKPIQFQERKYLLLNSFETNDVKNVANKLKNEILNWLIKFHDGADYKPNKKITLNLKAANLLSAKEVYQKPELPEDHKVAVKFDTSKEKKRELNKQSNGLPMITVEVINNGNNDVQFENLEILFNDFLDGSNFDSEIEKATSLSLSSLRYGNNATPGTTSFILKAAHKKEFHLQEYIFLKIILDRGIKAIIATDVSGNKYEVSSNEIDKEVEYLKLFFKSDGLKNLYK
jgi:hypothetical protein